MIFVDSNLFVIDLRHRDDVKYAVNRRALERLRREAIGLTSVLNVLEVCGILSFNLSAQALHSLYVHFAQRYGMTIVPGADYQTQLPSPTAKQIIERMERRMAIKDAEIALVVEEHAPGLSVFLTWNAKHFAGKLAVPSLTPRQWLRKRER